MVGSEESICTIPFEVEVFSIAGGWGLLHELKRRNCLIRYFCLFAIHKIAIRSDLWRKTGKKVSEKKRRRREEKR
jgi:hypothetical protein